METINKYLQQPAELIPLPSVLQKFIPKSKLRRPVCQMNELIKPMVPEKKKIKKHKEQNTSFVPSDSCNDHPRRAGRCKITLPDGTMIAVPNQINTICPDLCDDEQELTVVEIKGPGAERSWLEDDTVKFVKILNKNENILINRLDLQKFMTKKVSFTTYGKNPRRELYKTFAPFEEKNDILICLVPSEDILANCQGEVCLE